MKQLLNLKDLRENVSKYAALVAKGDSFIVTRRSKPLFRISPVEESGWETVIDFTELKHGGISAEELLQRFKKV